MLLLESCRKAISNSE